MGSLGEFRAGPGVLKFCPPFLVTPKPSGAGALAFRSTWPSAALGSAFENAFAGVLGSASVRSGARALIAARRDTSAVGRRIDESQPDVLRASAR